MNVAVSRRVCAKRVLGAVFAVVLALATPLFALDPSRALTQYVRTAWEDRLPHATVRAIVQSRDGFLWIGTYEGLVRFDGITFTTFDRRNTPMETSAVSALTEDARGGLWIGTVAGGLYRMESGVFSRVPLGQLGDIVSSLSATPDGSVWVSTRKGLGRITGGKLTIVTDGLPHQLIWAVRGVSASEVWVATEGGGLVHHREGRTKVYTDKDGLSSNVVYSMAIDRRGDVWIGTTGGVDIVNSSGIRRGLPAGSLLEQIPAFALLHDRSGNLWIGGGKRGLCRLSGGILTCEPPDPAGSDLIRSFAEDREGNLWIGGTNRGLWQLRDGKLTTTTGEASTNHVRTVTEAPDGTLVVGTDGSGVNLLKNNALVPMNGNERLPSPFIRSVRYDPSGTLWVGTLGGLARVEGDTITKFTTADGLTSNIVYAIEPERSGGVLIATSAGLNRFAGGKLETLPPEGDVRAILEDSVSGRLWIGRRDGLSCWERNRVTTCGAPENLRNATIFTFHQEKDGTVWIGTNHGITRFRAGVFEMYGSSRGLFDDNVFQILDDGRGHFWMSSNRGIWNVAKGDFKAFDDKAVPSLRSISFGKSDGMGTTQCNGASQPAGWRTRDGRLWFPTVKGVVSVDPLRIRSNPLPPPVVIDRIVIDSRVADSKVLHSVAPKAQRFEFHYTGLSFVAPDRVRFRFRLEGYDKDWVDAGARRVAYYTNLPAGNLRFMVMASNSDGVWSRPVGIPLTIEQSLVDSWWFRALAALLVGAILFGMYRLRVRQLERNERTLTELVAERTEALRAANAALEKLAAVDGLTRIPNRRSFDQRLSMMWSDHQRRQSPLAVILCDVDHFKNFNDSHGHIEGDDALVAVAQAIEKSVHRASDFAARYGGEEFVILLADTEAENAAAVARQILDNVRALAIRHATSPVGIVTLSAGIAATIPEGKSSSEELLQAADDALYRAKNTGRDRMEIAETVSAVA